MLRIWPGSRERRSSGWPGRRPLQRRLDDPFLHGGISNVRYLQEWGWEGAGGRQKLLVGPFDHGSLRGDLAYGETRASSEAEELRWFEYWLKGIPNGIMDEPPVTYYQMATARTSAGAGRRTSPSGRPASPPCCTSTCGTPR